MNEAGLTVKCVRQDGMFDIWPAKMVTFWPAETQPDAAAKAYVAVVLPDGTSGSFDRGTVYVMNASGKTIETIHLADSLATFGTARTTAAA